MLKIKARRWRSLDFTEIGRGGEAVIYDLGNESVAKVFHLPTATEFKDKPELIIAAEARLEEMQTKLFDFPENLPEQLVAPTGVLIDGSSRVFGYAMPFIDGVAMHKLCRANNALKYRAVGKFLAKLHDLVSELHACGIIIGDFNENNLIVSKSFPYLVDADSMQFGRYKCRSFVPIFAAPEVLQIERVREDPGNRSNMIISRRQKNRSKKAPLGYSMALPYDELTDWYSFLVNAMRLLTYTSPFGGFVNGIDLPERIDKRITVFDERVVYPEMAVPLEQVPRPVLELFFRAFKLNERFIPDREIFEALK